MNHRALVLSIALPAFSALAPLGFFALAPLGFIALAPLDAQADMLVPEPAELVVSGHAEAGGLTYVLRNDDRAVATIAMPHLVVLAHGIRLPVRVTSLTVDGAPHALGEPIAIAPGRSVTIHLTHEAITAPGDLELSFRGGGTHTMSHVLHR